MPDSPRRTTRLRQFSKAGIVMAPGAFNPSRLLVEQAVSAIYITGPAGEQLLGVPDIGLVSMARCCGRQTIVQVTGVPAICDVTPASATRST